MKKKMSLLIVLLFGTCFVTPYDFVSAEGFVDHKTAIDDLYYSGKKTREIVKDGQMHFTLETTYHENGIVEAIVTENKHTTHIQYNPATGMTLLNGVILESKKEFEMGLSAYKEVYMGAVTNNVPAGTLVGAAISLTSIWTRVPSSRVKQTVLTLTSLALGETLDKLIKVKIKQYRTSKPVKDGSMCYKQYKLSISPLGTIRKNKVNNKAQAGFYKVSPVKERENEQMSDMQETVYF
ncbi:hypothetical protein MOF20_05920 [Bacillus haynesii]|uniref:hypothetical protein n=1 Tax=Bacillus haynesii TaxID=1925021 RepID=UPI00227F9A6D|nr:hypothetical protein [Bacillus haynesii]MCY9262755.1 hypothetical protein [Bacillus haynesii]